jgi:replicative DNA helicase
MNRRKAIKRANDIVRYIANESGLQDPKIMRNAREYLVITIMAHNEVSQYFIDTLVKVFKQIKENREIKSAPTVTQTISAPQSLLIGE